MVVLTRDLEMGEGKPTKAQNRDEAIDGEYPQRSGGCIPGARGGCQKHVPHSDPAGEMEHTARGQ